MGRGFESLQIRHIRGSIAQFGQSTRLITEWSLVRVQLDPPFFCKDAPFVQWLGHQIFTLETGVQFPYGVPLQFYKMVGFPSGQRDQTVNLTAQPSKVRILPQPPSLKQSTTLRCSFFNSTPIL